MNSKEIADFIGQRAWLRKLGFWFIKLTTLREWYLNQAVRRVMADHKPAAFLDAGSGMGQHAIEVAAAYKLATVTGIELDAEQVHDCNVFVQQQKIPNVKFFEGDLQDYDYSSEFDAVFCSSVLEHLPDDRKAISRLHRALRPNGTLIAYVPMSEKRVLPSLERKIARQLRCENKQFPHDHVRYYQPNELAVRLTETGFNVVSKTITYGKFGRLAYDIVTTVQYSRYFKFLFPLYLALVHPFVMILMWADMQVTNKDGNGLMVIAKKV